MESAVGAYREEGVVARLEAVIGFLVLGIECFAEFVQYLPAVGELL